MLLHSRLPFLRWFAAALLAIIAMQALPAQAIPPALDRGPAFSASSIEVALAPRREVRADVRIAPVPLPPRPFVEPLLPAELSLRAEPWRAHRQQAPPATPPRRSIASPREPPLA
ncbi:MAG: hypothetical protein ACTHKM_12470 [Tsuneonella sp.]